MDVPILPSAHKIPDGLLSVLLRDSDLFPDRPDSSFGHGQTKWSHHSPNKFRLEVTNAHGFVLTTSHSRTAHFWDTKEVLDKTQFRAPPWCTCATMFGACCSALYFYLGRALRC